MLFAAPALAQEPESAQISVESNALHVDHGLLQTAQIFDCTASVGFVWSDAPVLTVSAASCNSNASTVNLQDGISECDNIARFRLAQPSTDKADREALKRKRYSLNTKITLLGEASAPIGEFSNIPAIARC